MMLPIHIHRNHTLGIDKAREIAKAWVEKAQERFDLQCQWSTDHTLHFKREGVWGKLEIAANHFELTAQLGFLFQAFSGKIERAVQKNLDALLGPTD
jgi:putative polyhydroxyalkanoate system protein